MRRACACWRGLSLMPSRRISACDDMLAETFPTARQPTDLSPKARVHGDRQRVHHAVGCVVLCNLLRNDDIADCRPKLAEDEARNGVGVLAPRLAIELGGLVQPGIERHRDGAGAAGERGA